MDATSKRYDDFAVVKKKGNYTSCYELKDKGYFPDFKVKEEKGDSGNKVIALLVKF